MSIFKSVTSNSYFLAILATFFWSFNVIIANSLRHELTPAEITFWRWAIAGLILLPFTFKEILHKQAIIRKNILLLIVLGVLGISTMNTLIYAASHTASIIDIALLGTLGPIFLAIISSVFLHNKLSRLKSLGMLISLIGVLFIVSHGSLQSLAQFNFVRGDLYVILRNIIFATYTILLSRKPKELSSESFLACTIFCGLVPLAGYLFLQGEMRFITEFSSKSILLLLYMGIFPSLVAFLCWNVALLKLGAVELSLVYYLIPLMSVVEAYLILGQTITMAQVVGGVIVLCGILLASVHQKQYQSIVHH